MNEFFRVACLGFVAVVCVSCSDYQRAKQLRTYTDMQAIVAAIESRRSAQGDLPSRAEVLREVENVEHGRDAWGNRLLVATRETANSTSYVIVSYGSDGRPSLREDEYFALAEQGPIHDTQQDIVFRDGKPITLAGK